MIHRLIGHSHKIYTEACEIEDEKEGENSLLSIIMISCAVQTVLGFPIFVYLTSVSQFVIIRFLKSSSHYQSIVSFLYKKEMFADQDKTENVKIKVTGINRIL